MQPYQYQYQPPREAAWQRIPGWRHVTAKEWNSAQWQRTHCIKNIKELKAALEETVAEHLYEDLARDQREHATMSMLLPPHMLETIAPEDTRADRTASWYEDPVRRYMLPLASDRATPASHPLAERDSLHEREMWAVEGLTHRYPSKVLAELLTTCPQYCGHCTRMDLVGNPTPQVAKLKLLGKPAERHTQILTHLAAHPEIRDVVVSGGDVANMPWPRLSEFVEKLIELPNIRDIRLATKALIGLPQHWAQEPILEGLEELAGKGEREGTQLAVHTHTNHAAQLGTLTSTIAARLRAAGIDVRNQGVLLRGVNDTPEALLDLSYTLQDQRITPYYLYLCDMIPGSEHWRLPLKDAQRLQEEIMGHLPGFATPRIVADVPYVGKRWVHQAVSYDEVRGTSYWRKSYPTPGGEDLEQTWPMYDPIWSLPEEGRRWWQETPQELAAESSRPEA